jgi:hypothetical protein
MFLSLLVSSNLSLILHSTQFAIFNFTFHSSSYASLLRLLVPIYIFFIIVNVMFSNTVFKRNICMYIYDERMENTMLERNNRLRE